MVRTYGILLKLNEDEKEELFEKAKEMHLSKAGYIRMMVFGNLRASEDIYKNIKKKPKPALKQIKQYILFQKELVSEFKSKILNNNFKLEKIPISELEDIRARREERLLTINNKRKEINKKTIEVLKGYESEEKPLEIS